MGINIGAFVSPFLTERLAAMFTGASMVQNYKVVFLATGVGMLLSFLWFWFGRRQLHGIGRPPQDSPEKRNLGIVVVGAAVLVPLVYFLLAKLGADVLAWVLGFMFVGLALMLVVEGLREGAVARDKVVAMLIIFVFNILFWMFYEQAGS